MKNRIISLIIICVVAGLCSSAFALGSGSKAIGNFYLTNGERIDSVEFEMPTEREMQVKVKIDGKVKKIETDSIFSIILWNKKSPDNKYVFRPFYPEVINYDTGEFIEYWKKPIWLSLDVIGDYASYWFEIGRPSFKKNKIVFNFRQSCTPYSLAFVLKEGSEHPCYVPNSQKKVKGWIKLYLKDDPELVKRIDAGEYDAGKWANKYIDLIRIIKDYNPAK